MYDILTFEHVSLFVKKSDCICWGKIPKMTGVDYFRVCFPQMQFPSISSLQGGLPSVLPSGAMHPSSLGNPSHAWTPTTMSTMQGIMPNVPPSGTMHPSSLGNPSHAWNPAPSSSVLPPQAQTHGPALGPSIVILLPFFNYFLYAYITCFLSVS